MSDTACMLRITTSNRDAARVSVGRQQFAVGRPIEFDERSGRIAAVEYLLGALGAEAATGLRLFADRRRIAIDEVEALVTGELQDALSFLEVVGRTGEPKIARVHVKLFVLSDDPDGVRRVWDIAKRRLPLLCTLGGALPIEVDLVVTS